MHLSDTTVAAYVDGALGLDEICQVDDHIDQCASCRDQLSAVAATPHSFIGDASGSTPGLTELVRETVATGRAGDPLVTTLGRYELDRVLGRGGMGVVVRARDPELDRWIAIKLVDPAHHRGAWRMHVRDEARAMAKLRHPNVVAVYDAGSIGEHLFIAMELVEGSSLTKRTGNPLRALRDAGRGICAAHAVGLIHGDIKPDNILVGDDGRALIGDFGLARAIADQADRGVAGTHGYMAPELARGEPATMASDQFAFAVTVYEMLVGERPTGRLRPAAIDRRLWRALDRALDPDPAKRFATMAELTAALEPRRRWVIPAALAVVAGGAGLAMMMTHQSTCADPSDLARAMAPTCSGSACAELGERALAWRTTSVAVCKADNRAGARCLDQRLVEQAQLAAQIALTPNDPKALVAVEQLERPETCLAATTSFTPRIDQLPMWLAAQQWVASALANRWLGRYSAALDELAPRFAIIRATGDQDLVANAALVLADAQVTAGHLDAAETVFDIGMRAAAAASDDILGAKLLIRLGQLLGDSRQQWDRGAELLRAADAMVVRAGNPPDLVADLAITRGLLAEARGDNAAALAAYTRTIEMRRHGRPDELAFALEARCDVEVRTDAIDQARRDCTEAVEIVKAAFGAVHPLVAEAETNLGIVAASHHEFREARTLWTHALATLDKADDALGLATVLLDLGELSLDTQDYPAAKLYIDRLRTTEASAETSPQDLDVQLRLAHLLRDTETPAAEINALEDIARRAEATFGLASRTTAHALEDLAIAYYRSHRMADAKPTFARAVTAAQTLYGPRHVTTLAVEGRYAQSLLELGEFKAALPMLEQISALAEQVTPADSAQRAEAYTNLADCLLSLGEVPRAIEVAQRGLAIREKVGDDLLQMSEVRFILAKAFARAHDPRAIATAEKSRDEMKAVGKRATTLPEVEAFIASSRQARAR